MSCSLVPREGLLYLPGGTCISSSIVIIYVNTLFPTVQLVRAWAMRQLVFSPVLCGHID